MPHRLSINSATKRCPGQSQRSLDEESELPQPVAAAEREAGRLLPKNTAEALSEVAGSQQRADKTHRNSTLQLHAEPGRLQAARQRPLEIPEVH